MTIHQQPTSFVNHIHLKGREYHATPGFLSTSIRIGDPICEAIYWWSYTNCYPRTTGKSEVINFDAYWPLSYSLFISVIINNHQMATN